MPQNVGAEYVTAGAVCSNTLTLLPNTRTLLPNTLALLPNTRTLLHALCYRGFRMLTYADVCERMLLVPSEAATNTSRGCCYYVNELLLVPQAAATNTSRGCY
jgi:hypothetical protein